MDNSGMATGGKMEVKPPIVCNRLPSKHSPGDARSLTTEMHPNHFSISFSLLFSVLPPPSLTQSYCTLLEPTIGYLRTR